ncbi:unnamed protein product, partial [marine sediment metagenome]
MSVKSWGRGRPDYYKPTMPAKTTVASIVQARFNYSLEVELPAQMDTGLVTAYTIPAGMQLNVTFWKGSANKSGLLYGYIYNTGTFYGRATIDVFQTGSTGESGAYVFDAGDVFQYRVVNPMLEAVSVAFRFA